MPETRVGNRSPAKKIGSAKGEKNKPVKIPASFPEKSEKIRDGALPKGLENPNWSGEKIEEMLSGQGLRFLLFFSVHSASASMDFHAPSASITLSASNVAAK